MENEKYELVKDEFWSNFWQVIYWIVFAVVVLLFPLGAWIYSLCVELTETETFYLWLAVKIAPVLWIIVTGFIMYQIYGDEWQAEWRKEDRERLEQFIKERKKNGKN